jgi:hypothetical protein
MADPDGEDMGTSFMRKHMSEAQPSTEPGGFGYKTQFGGPRGGNRATDSGMERRYGGGDKSLAMDPDATEGPDRSRKGSKRGR